MTESLTRESTPQHSTRKLLPVTGFATSKLVLVTVTCGPKQLRPFRGLGPRRQNAHHRNVSLPPQPSPPAMRRMSCRLQQKKMQEEAEQLLLTARAGRRPGSGSSLAEEGLAAEPESLPAEASPSWSRAVLGVEMSPTIAAIALVYFVQGVVGLARLATSYFLKDDLDLDPSQVSLLTSASSLPWLIKPLYGFLSDSVPLFGYRRRSYLIICGILGAAGWTALATVVTGPGGALAAVLLASLSTAASDVVVDSLVVERARREGRAASGTLQSLCWGAQAMGGIVSAYFSGSLVQAYGSRFVFGTTALLPLLISVAAMLVDERPSAVQTGGALAILRPQVERLWGALKQRAIWLPTLFIFMWQATPQAESAMFFFTTDELGFTPEFLGRVRLATALASLAGVAAFNGGLKHVPTRVMLTWTTILGSGLGMLQLVLVTGTNRAWGISDQWFALGDSLVMTVLGQVAFMPILVLATRICPEGVEATLFATLMSVFNAGAVVAGLFGAALMQALGVTSHEFTNLPLLIVLCNMSSLLPLPFLYLVQGAIPEDESPDSLKHVEHVSKLSGARKVADD